jgi:hypothetical protein
VDSCGHVSSRQAINATVSRDFGADGAYPLLEAPGRGDWLPGLVSGQGGRRNGQTDGEILPAHIYQNEEKRMCGLLSGFILFRLVAPTLQPRVVGPYPV